MKFLRELLVNANATYRLQRKYYWLTTCVGIFAGAAGIAVMYAAAHLLASMLGVSLSARASPLWIALFLFAIPLSFYLAMVVVVGTFGLFMVCAGRFTLSEAQHYALRSRYPQRWFADGEA